ncbi:MAG: proprotein convertase P-domain-containing protein [Proteobacteria bacterium]|nr:proprotein convertase P-domain-containing protein [Pseudomonadota bacterium]
MSGTEKTYTYRAGQKIVLKKSPDQMVVRALPDKLDDPAIIKSEQVSSASMRITTSLGELESMMSRSRTIAPTHHAYFEAQTGAEFLITDRIFVVFKEPPSDKEFDEFAARYGLVKKAVYSDRDYLFQLTNHTGMNPVKLVVKLTEEDPLVEAAEHDLNQRVQTNQFAVPLDPQYGREWHLHTGLNDPDYDTRACSQCEDAWRLLDHYGSEGVVIAISDDGCKLDHHDFDSPGKFAGWGYFRGERLITSGDIDADPAEMYKLGSNHGTSCAGVIGGEIDALLTVGAAPGCSLFPIQWESDGPSLYISDSKLMTALNFIADKVDVMSNSWSGVPYFVLAHPVVNRITDLAKTGGRRGKGIVFIWAAGNDNCPINHTASVDIAYNHGWKIYNDGSVEWIGPDTARVFRRNFAEIPGVMNIAALASTARRSHYSNYGPGISLCAPSSNGHAYYRMEVRGLGITTTTGEPGGVIHEFGGTSSATPLVAGIAALTISANPDLTALEVVSILQQTAAKDLDFQSYPQTPPAVFDPDTSWDISPIAPFDNGDFTDTGDADGSWSSWFGHGRVDATAAVAEALRRGGEPGDLIFQGDSSPDKSIPDNNSRGIKDSIVCDETFILRSIKARVDITHSYIGDLIVSLISPSGTSVVLHERTGGSANDLHSEFDINSVPMLRFLSDESVEGTWTLHVQDLAARDRGRLQSWSLEISGQRQTVINVEENPGIIIPDNIPGGIERSLSVADSGQLDGIQVEIDITHTYIGDLLVELVSPSNTRVLLHNRTGGSANNIIKTYSGVNTPNLPVLHGEPINGLWKLYVSDRAGADQGKLNRWALKLMQVA